MESLHYTSPFHCSENDVQRNARTLDEFSCKRRHLLRRQLSTVNRNPTWHEPSRRKEVEAEGDLKERAFETGAPRVAVTRRAFGDVTTPESAKHFQPAS